MTWNNRLSFYFCFRGEFLDLEGEIDFNQAMESVLETSYKITIIDLVKLGDPMNRFETARRFLRKINQLINQHFILNSTNIF